MLLSRRQLVQGLLDSASCMQLLVGFSPVQRCEGNAVNRSWAESIPAASPHFCPSKVRLKFTFVLSAIQIKDFISMRTC